MRARERRTSASTARTSVKSRTIAVTSSGPLGATRASSSRRPPGVEGEVVRLQTTGVEGVGSPRAALGPDDGEHRLVEVPARRHHYVLGDVGFVDGCRGVGEIVAIAVEADHPVRDRVDDRPQPALALAVEPDEQRDRDGGRREVAGRDQYRRHILGDVGDPSDEVDHEGGQEDEPGDEDRQQLPPRAGGAISQRRTMTTVVIVARARPPYSPVGPDRREQRRREEDVEAVAPTARIATATRSTRDVEPAARIGEDQGKEQDGGGVLEGQADLVDNRDRGMGERPDEPGQPDCGHQRAGPVRRLVAPDRQSAVEVRQPDRQVEETGAGCLAVPEAERLGDDRRRSCRGPDREANAAATHDQHSDTWARAQEQGRP